MRRNALNDITETTGLVFLGLTIGCARCHDHKTDPISQFDFYGLQAFFSAARFRDDYPLTSAPRRREHEHTVTAWRTKVAQIQASILRIEEPLRDKLAPGLPMGALDLAVAAYNKPEAERSPAEVTMIYDLLCRDNRIKADSWPTLLGAGLAEKRARLIARLEETRRAAPPACPTARNRRGRKWRTADISPQARRIRREGTGCRRSVSGRSGIGGSGDRATSRLDRPTQGDLPSG